MKGIGFNFNLNSILLGFISVLFAISITIPTIMLGNQSTLIAGEQKQEDSVTIRNESYGFEITVPKSWTFKKVVQPDPDEGMMSGQASFSISTGGSEEEPENWNGLVFNSTGSSDNPQPFVSVYAHEKALQKPEEFAKLFENSIEGFQGKVINVNHTFSVGDAKGFDYTYNLFLQSRFVALYRNGQRVVIQYFFPASDQSLFEKHAPEVYEVIRSLRMK